MPKYIWGGGGGKEEADIAQALGRQATKGPSQQKACLHAALSPPGTSCTLSICILQSELEEPMQIWEKRGHFSFQEKKQERNANAQLGKEAGVSVLGHCAPSVGQSLNPCHSWRACPVPDLSRGGTAGDHGGRSPTTTKTYRQRLSFAKSLEMMCMMGGRSQRCQHNTQGRFPQPAQGTLT